MHRSLQEDLVEILKNSSLTTGLYRSLSEDFVEILVRTSPRSHCLKISQVPCPRRAFEMRWNEIMLCHVMLSCYHVMSAWVVYGLATWPCPKLEVRRYVCSSHHWPLRWPSTNDERDGPLLIPFDPGFPTHSKPLGHDFPYEKDCPQYSCFQLVMA